jgi:tRNA1Val (adenine37-N6)-methyltransferase
MGKNSFQFRQFTVHQDRCAMKVGTDGTLLGAWASLGVPDGRILDIGTGTGLIALMMAQRFPKSHVTAIDIDTEAVGQARENVVSSPFSERIRVEQADVRSFQSDGLYDAIVSNPPYFSHALECPDSQRTMARHTTSLSYESLMSSAYHLLSEEGRFSVIIPDDFNQDFVAEAYLQGFFQTRLCMVRTTLLKRPRRYLIEFRKHPVKQVDMYEGIIELSPSVRSQWYQSLTQDFYIK